MPNIADLQQEIFGPVLHGIIDLAKAVKTVGVSRGGETEPDTLAGQINTQGTAR